MLTPRHSHKYFPNTRSLLLKIQSSWYRSYIRNKVRIPVITMVSARQASTDKDAAAKAPPPRTSSKSNPAKPPKAPKRTSSKDLLSRSSSASKLAASATDPAQPPPQEVPMEIENAPSGASSLPVSNTTPSTEAQSSPNASPAEVTTVQPTATVTASDPSSPPQSPRHQQQQSALASQTTPPHHNRSPATRKNKVYFNLHITPTPLPPGTKATATMKLEAYHQSFLKVIDALIHVDDSLAFWPFEEANAPESALLKTPTALGSSINQIIKFFDSFWVSKTFSQAYVNCLIGFNMDTDAFMYSASSMLTDIPAKIFKRTLQVPHTATLGWIFGTHENFAIKDFEVLLQDAAARLAPNQFPPVQFGLNFKPIWDGSSCADREKDKSHNKWAIHVDAIAEIASTSKALLKKALASPWLHAYTNLPLLLVPVLTKKTPNSEADDIKRAIARHGTVIQSMSKSFSSKILSLDRPLSALANATLRTTVMAITNSAGKKLFLSVDHNWNGQGFIFTYPTLYASQASDYVKYLPVYLAHSHCDDVYRWFTPDAVAEAQAMGWDDEKKQPISKDGLDLRTSIQSLDLEWCIAPPPLPPKRRRRLIWITSHYRRSTRLQNLLLFNQAYHRSPQTRFRLLPNLCSRSNRMILPWRLPLILAFLPLNGPVLSYPRYFKN